MEIRSAATILKKFLSGALVRTVSVRKTFSTKNSIKNVFLPYNFQNSAPLSILSAILKLK